MKIAIDVPAAPEWINWNKNFGALAKLNPSSVSESKWIDSARQDPDPVWRLLATWQLLGELGNPNLKAETMPTDSAMGAILDVLTKDPSPYVREAVLDRLAQTRFKKLPEAFSEPIVNLAKRPEGLTEDPAGYIRVRRAAMSALGRTENVDGHKWALEQLAKRELDINYIGGYAATAARLGTAASLGTLGAALVTQKGRGPAYYRRAAEALSLSTSVDALALLRDVLTGAPGDNELHRTVTAGFAGNRDLRETQAFANLVRDVVLDEKTFTEEFRAEFLEYLDDVKYESARVALAEIAEKSPSERLKASAKRVLAANFPAAPAAKDTGKKKKK